MYREGQGFPQNYETTAKWYTLAAEQGNASAQTLLGFLYSSGEGVIQDDVYAHMWWNIATSEGAKGAAKQREIVAESMTPSQLEKAQDLARKCVKKNYKGC